MDRSRKIFPSPKGLTLVFAAPVCILLVVEPRNPALETGADHYFVTTCWHLIDASTQDRSEENRAGEALAQLCQIYWQPIFAYIVRRGYSQEDARDFTQDFFVKILEPGFFEKADRAKGKFRTLLRACLKNFLRDQETRAQASKRGGGVAALSLEDWKEENARPAMDSSWSPERVFDTRWAFAISENALARLREECTRKGRERAFIELAPFLSAPADAGEYERAQAALGLRVDAVRTLVSRLRERYRALLREEVAATVLSTEMIHEELAYLHSLLIGGRSEQSVS